jgi:hypothetical protein
MTNKLKKKTKLQEGPEAKKTFEETMRALFRAPKVQSTKKGKD